MRLRLLDGRTEDDAPQKFLLWLQEEQVDSRGNRHYLPAGEPVECWGTFSEDKSQDAELPGQITVQTWKVTSRDAPIGAYSHIRWAGEDWDVVGDPFHQKGVSRLTRHAHFMVRSRNVKGVPGG